MELVKSFTNAFWSEKFWLPSNITWNDLEPGSHGVNHADYRHLVWPIPLSIVIVILRYFTERNFLMPLGKSLGIKSSRVNPPVPSKELESAYRTSSKLNKQKMLKLTKQLDLSDRDIERWWRRRKAQDKPSTLVKFCENSWRCLFYTFNFGLGLNALWDKPYMWSLLQCALDYPHHEVTNDVWWYYMSSMAFYWSLTFSQFIDNKRKDFWQMFIHHVLTLVLFIFSWICNIHRVGSLILLVHDSADVLVEAAKALKYAKFQRTCDIVFGLFTVTWIVTRLLIFPRIIYACIFQTLQPIYPAYFLFNTILVMILILHIIWTYMIYEVIAQSLKTGEINRDVRSSSDDDLTDDGSAVMKVS